MKAIFDIQGHRGCRGLYPENSIPGFIHALDLGVSTLELDTVISKDLQVVVSHEAYLNHEICDAFQGKKISNQNEKEFNLYQLAYADIVHADCGLKPHPRFPEQLKISTYKPLLAELFQNIENRIVANNLKPCRYNIEIKSLPETDNLYHPTYPVFCDLVLKVIQDFRLLDRVTIQCFDYRPLQYLSKIYSQLSLSLLIEDDEPIENHIQKLGFKPSVYSPYYQLIDSNTIEYCRKHLIQLIPWTVNTVDEMQQLIDLGVDGIITDYPNIYFNQFER